MVLVGEGKGDSDKVFLSPEPNWDSVSLQGEGSSWGLPTSHSFALLPAPSTWPFASGLGCRVWTLTLQAEMTPSPPAQTMVSLTVEPHQSLWEHVA